MKIVATGDWHIHEFHEFSTQIPMIWNPSNGRFIENSAGKLMNSRLYHILDGICDIRDYCVKNGIKYVLNAGDVFHKRGTISVNAFNAAYKVINSFKEVGIQLITIAGNHDQVDASDCPSTSIHTFNKISTVIEYPQIINIDDVNILALPYSKNKNFLMSEYYRLTSQLDLSKSILLAHLGINGGIIGSGTSISTEDYNLEELSPEKWKYIILGHFHRPQLLGYTAFYTGTPVQNSFSDELPIEEYGGYNGFFEVSDTNLKFIPVLQPRFVTITSMEHANGKDYFRIKSKSGEILSPINESNVRVEIEKDYTQPIRSSISIEDSFTNIVKKYANENCKEDLDVLPIGLEILHEAQELIDL